MIPKYQMMFIFDVYFADNFLFSFLHLNIIVGKKLRYQTHKTEQNGILIQVYLYGNEKIIK